MAAFPARSVEGLDTVLVWFRRDLRLYDNPSLVCALQCAKRVIPIYIHAPEEDGQFQLGRTSRWWLKQTLQHLSSDIARLGSRLIIRRSPTGEALPSILELLRETGAQALFFNHLYDAISLTRDHDVKMAVEGAGLMCRSFNSELLYEPWEVLDDDDEPFVTFMDFWNRVITMPQPPSYPLPPPSWLTPVPDDLPGRTVDETDFFQSAVQEGSVEQLKYRWDVSTASGHARLEKFLEHTLPSFDHDRAKVDRNSTSQMSPWLHVGSVSERYIYYRVVSHHAELLRAGHDCTASCLQFLQQCGYREYSRYLSFHFPFVTERSLLAHLRACPCRLDQARFKAWKKGETGYPLVDAAMRQLWSNGWIHNRLRVVVASFMVKNLLLPWQWGLKHLWDAQIDGDLEIDALGWQYVAGCLIDGHPFSYMIDMDVESKRFDPDGQYVRQWLPVLALLPNEFVHHPWRAPADLLEEAGVELGFNYSHPIVSIKESQRDVHWANSVIERCCSGTASGANNQHHPSSSPGGSSGTEAMNNDGVNGGADGMIVPRSNVPEEQSGSASGQAIVVNRQPKKQPYKPPSDPAIQAAFLKIPGGSSGGGVGGGSGAGAGAGGRSSNGSELFDALRAVKPDVAGLRLPEHLYRRNPSFGEVFGDRSAPRRSSRRHGGGGAGRPSLLPSRSGAPARIAPAPAKSQHSGARVKPRGAAGGKLRAPPSPGVDEDDEVLDMVEEEEDNLSSQSEVASNRIAGDIGVVDGFEAAPIAGVSGGSSSGDDTAADSSGGGAHRKGAADKGRRGGGGAAVAGAAAAAPDGEHNSSHHRKVAGAHVVQLDAAAAGDLSDEDCHSCGSNGANND